MLPIFKKGDRSDFGNYRPVSLLNICSKVCEKIIFKHLFNYCRDNDIISMHQSGFTPGDSTVHQLVYLYNTFCKALNNKKDIRIVFCDQSKAFDRVWHQGLLYKLECIGITGDLLSWFRSYLHNREQRVIIHGSSSKWGRIPAGVPQGAVLGPLAFFIYINDITENIKSNIKLFADDTSLYVTIDEDAVTATPNQSINQFYFFLSATSSMPLALYNGTHTFSLNTYIYIYSEMQHTYKHSYKAAISAQIQCFFFLFHSHTLSHSWTLRAARAFLILGNPPLVLKSPPGVLPSMLQQPRQHHSRPTLIQPLVALLSLSR